MAVARTVGLSSTVRINSVLPVGATSRFRRGSLAAGEIQFEQRTLSDLAFRADVSAGLPNKSIDHAQPQPGPLTCGFGREEWFKDSGKHARRHAAPGVAHFDHGVVTRYDVGQLAFAPAIDA